MSELFMQTHGHGDTQLVLLPGWAMHGDVFASLVDALQHRCTLHVVDLPGHGGSRTSDLPLEPQTCVRAIAAVTPPAIWLGWSMGGLIALTAALQRTDKVRALAMLSSSPCFVRRDSWEHGMQASVLAQFSSDLEHDYHATLQRFLALQVGGSAHARDELRRLRSVVFAHGEPDKRALKQGLELLGQSDLRDELGKLRQHSVWIAGDRDRLVPCAAMAWAAEQCEGSYISISHAGHATCIGFAEAVVDALAPLLEGAEA